MEALLLVLALASDPARIDGRAAWYTTPGAPLVIPVEALPAPYRASRLLAELRLELGLRVELALAWGAEAAALRAAARHAPPLASDAQLDLALRRWAENACARFRIPADAALAAIASDGNPRQPTSEERGALADVHELLTTLAWPRWRGPLLLVPYGVNHAAIAPGMARVVRPALPVLRIPGPDRDGLTVAIADLCLSLSAPPAEGWPAWLVSGVAGCAQARGSGSGIPERAMAERRAAAGVAAIRRLLEDGTVEDAGLATAVVAALLHPNRRRRLPDLLELLRHGTRGAGAIAAAYRLSLEDLAAPPEAGRPQR
ncbi:MAG TPA: hypothetical protein DCS97_10965 [Planctomycetes bacterium]|nr:hypothetical protein [Planctomycetota bacterium]